MTSQFLEECPPYSGAGIAARADAQGRLSPVEDCGAACQQVMPGDESPWFPLFTELQVLTASLNSDDLIHSPDLHLLRSLVAPQEGT